MGTQRRRYLVSGRVQGVFFRSHTRQQAQRLGLAGWVRNRPDGCVEAVAEGDPASLARLEDFLRRGPPEARVEDLAITADASHEELRDFTVR